MARALKTLAERKKSVAAKLSSEPAESNLKTLELELEYPIAATPQRVWQIMTRQSSRWWKEAGFYSRPNSTRFHIEPVVGGRMWEELRGGGGILWWNITGFEPAKSLTLIGPMGSATKLAVEEVRIRLAPNEKGCVLRLEDRFLGRISNEKKHLQIFTDGWNQLFGCLKKLCEEKVTRGGRSRRKILKPKRK